MEQDRGTPVPPGSPVTVVVTRDVVPGRERDYEEWAHRVVSATARLGATGHTILTPDAGVPNPRGRPRRSGRCPSGPRGDTSSGARTCVTSTSWTRASSAPDRGPRGRSWLAVCARQFMTTRSRRGRPLRSA